MTRAKQQLPSTHIAEPTEVER